MKLVIYKIAAIITILLVSSCSQTIVKPTYLYEDGTLYQRIQKQKLDLIKNSNIHKIRKQLNDYDTYTNKAHKVLSENHKRALK